MDQSPTVAISLRCPRCDVHLPHHEPGPSSTNPFFPAADNVIHASYTSEGGLEPAIDLMPYITEEAYLLNHPETRLARAFQALCSEGDVDGTVSLIVSLQNQHEDEPDLMSVIHYRDPLAGNKSSLHLAVESGREEIALLLIWLCSTASTEWFAKSAREKAASAGIVRLNIHPNQDVRALQDEHGSTAGELARQLEGPWIPYLDAGLFNLSSTSSAD